MVCPSETPACRQPHSRLLVSPKITGRSGLHADERAVLSTPENDSTRTFSGVLPMSQPLAPWWSHRRAGLSALPPPTTCHQLRPPVRTHCLPLPEPSRAVGPVSASEGGEGESLPATRHGGHTAASACEDSGLGVGSVALPPLSQGPRPPDRPLKEWLCFLPPVPRGEVGDSRVRVSLLGRERESPHRVAVVPELRGSEVALSGKARLSPPQ